MSKGTLFVISAPSGCGKGTVLKEVLENDSNIYYSVSATTRLPREGEIEGISYYFHTKESFTELIEQNGVLEYAKFCDNYYGTPRRQVEEKLEAGFDVILEIETNGAMQIKKNFCEAVSIFMLPPSIKELRRRLMKRGTEPMDIIEKRVNEASREIECAKDYDYIMVNNELEKAVIDLKAIMTACKLTNIKNKGKIDEVLKNA